jgi:hypothetical protein
MISSEGFSIFFIIYVTYNYDRFALPDIVFSLIEEQPWAAPVGDFMVAL